MKKEQIKDKAISLHHWAWQEEPDSPKWKRTIRNLLRISEFFWEEARKNALSLRASALTYIMVLSMVPLIALGTAVLKGLGASNMAKKAAYQFIEQFEDQKGQNQFAKHLREAIDKIFEYVDKTNFATLGVVGILGLIWAVLTTLTKIENALNQIWKVEKSRDLGRKILDYIAITVLMPLSINIALGFTAASQVKKITVFLDKFVPVPLFSALIVKIIPVALLVITFTVLYRFLPNAHVKAMPALIGGIVGGVGWLLVQFIYIKLQIGVTRYNAIYGSFATIPLFLIWLYWGWLVFLYGAQIAFVAQYWKGYRPDLKASPVLTLSMAIDIVKNMYQKFSQAEEFNPQVASEELSIPESLITKVLSTLKEHKLIKETANGAYLPAMPAEKFKLSAILDAVCGTVTPATFGQQATTEALDAAKKRLEEFNLQC